MMYENVVKGHESYIRSRQLVKEGQVRHYVHWVRKFLMFASREGIKEFDACLLRFLQDLEEREQVRDWQVGQAKNAVHVYYYQFRKKGRENSTCRPLDAIDPSDFEQVREKAIAVLRLRNYAFRTEETYVGWMQRFYGFVKENRGHGASPVSEDVRNFVTHLALKENTSASTQNQAFNALLFMAGMSSGLSWRTWTRM